MIQGYAAIDVGTTSVKVVVYSVDGHVLGQVSNAIGIANPAAGCFEQDAVEILETVDASLEAAVEKSSSVAVQGIAISNQRESVVAFDRRNGRPKSRVIGWQDSRTEDDCRRLEQQGWALRFRRATGLHLDPMYSATKLAYLARQLGGLEESDEEIALSTLDSLIITHLTDGDVFATDPTNACRTLLFNIWDGGWDTELCGAAGVSESALPRVRPSDDLFGRYRGSSRALKSVPICGVLGDSHAALFGHHCESGMGKVTLGTGSSLMVICEPDRSLESPVDTTIGYMASGRTWYAREGNVLAAGAGVESAARAFNFSSVAELIRAAEQVQETRMAYVPAFSGLAAPWWDRGAVGVVVGMARDATSCDIAKAVVDSVGHQLADILDVIQKEGTCVTSLRADGGLARDNSVVQSVADILGVSIEVAEQPNASAYGAARMCAAGLGRLQEFDSSSAAYRRFEPHMTNTQRGEVRSLWRDAVLRSRGLEVLQEGDRDE